MQIYFQVGTRNTSFIKMHEYLEAIGIKNNKFMLTLLDPDLAQIDPYDPNLSQYMKAKVLRECMSNFWYFAREIIRVPDQGGNGTFLNLHRGNMALFYCLIYNLNVFLELPRQLGKTLSATVFYLYSFNFGTTNSTIAFMHKRLDGSKDNLQKLKDLRDALPEYLRMDRPFVRRNQDKKSKASDTILTLEHSVNRNKIITVASARNKVSAQNLLRGKSIPLLWGDEWAFCPYNDIIYVNSAPAIKRAADIAKSNGSNHSILFTTTPGFLTSSEGLTAFQMKEDATPFIEKWYDLKYSELLDIINANMRSNFVYIKFTYQQLGCSEKWFVEICILMQNKWADIRREVLLEWSTSTENSPFSQEELEEVDRLTNTPIDNILLCDNKFSLNIYKKIRYNSSGQPVNPPIIGVDVSGGYKRDASALTIVDSETTEVIGDFKSNYISQIDLAKVLFETVTRFMPNAIINVERNGGFGAAVIALLKKTKIKNNLYYEYKEKITEEYASNGVHTVKQKKLQKVFGLDSSKNIRELLMGILRERMEHHKDKFNSKLLYNEFLGLEVKRDGKIDHTSTTHDDLTFSYLLALYVWYEGKNLKERYGIKKQVLKTEDDVDDSVFDAVDESVDITDEIDTIQKDISDIEKNDSKLNLNNFKKSIGITFNEWETKQKLKEEENLMNLLRSHPDAFKAYAYKYHMSTEDIDITKDKLNADDAMNLSSAFFNILNNENENSVFSNDLNDENTYLLNDEENYSVLQGNLAGILKTLKIDDK